MGVGDEILAAGQAQRLYEQDPRLRSVIVGIDSKPRWHEIWANNPAIATPDEFYRGGPFRLLPNGPNCRPYIVYPFTKDTGWTFNKSFKARDHVAKIYLTAAEIARGVEAFKKYGPYILIEPYTKHDNFRWSMEDWSTFVAEHSKEFTFVQHVHKDSEVIPGVQTESATFREACGLLTGARAYVRSESGMTHAAAALGVRQVTIWGGCMDPDVLGGYPLQVNVADRGTGSPCGRWHPCEHCATVMKAITPKRIARALRKALALKGNETDLYA